MADKYIVSGTTDRSRNGTEEVVFEKDKDGNPSKFVSATHPEELTKNDLDTLSSLGVTVEKVSAEKAAEIEEEAAEDSSVATDTAGAAPVFGSGSTSGAGASSGSGK